MPRKIRDLIADLERAGFRLVPGGKGSHRKYPHPRLGQSVILSGKTGQDAKFVPGKRRQSRNQNHETGGSLFQMGRVERRGPVLHWPLSRSLFRGVSRERSGGSLHRTLSPRRRSRGRLRIVRLSPSSGANSPDAESGLVLGRGFSDALFCPSLRPTRNAVLTKS